MGGSADRPASSELDYARERLFEETSGGIRMIRMDDASIGIEIEKMKPGFLVGPVPHRGAQIE
jgi:hypothetical protein